MSQDRAPQGWNSLRLEEVCDILDSKRVPLNSEQRFAIKGNIPYYGANGIVDYINDFLFDEDLILVAEDGGNFEDYVNRSIAYKISGKSWVNNHAHVLRVRKDFDLDFIFYTLEHKNIVPVIKGGTRTKLNQAELRDISLMVPESIREQHRISTIISTIDLAIIQTKDLIEKCKKIRYGLMRDVFTSGIAENGKPHSEMETSIFGQIPQKWNVVSLEEISTNITDGSHFSPTPQEDGYLIANVKDMEYDSINFSTCTKISRKDFENLRRNGCCPHKGDILLSKDGTIGKIVVLDSEKEIACLSSIAIITPRIDSNYLGHLLRSDHFQKQILRLQSGSALRRIVLRDIKKFQIPVSPIKSEQKKIAQLLDSSDMRIKSIQSHLSKLIKIKHGIMQDLLAGRVRLAA